MSRFLPFFAIIFAIAVFFMYVRPTYSGPINETRAKIDSYDSALAAAERFEQKQAELVRAREAISPESLERLRNFLPDGVDNVQLILDLDALAARSGMTLSGFDISTQDTGAAESTAPGQGSGLTLAGTSPVDSIDLTFKAVGTYAAFRTFLTGIEQSLRPLDVINLDVQESATGVYTYAVTVRIYWLR